MRKRVEEFLELVLSHSSSSQTLMLFHLVLRCIKCGWYAFNEVDGSSEALAELVAVAHAICAYFDIVVGERPPELAGRALGLDLWNLAYEIYVQTP